MSEQQMKCLVEILHALLDGVLERPDEARVREIVAEARATPAAGFAPAVGGGGIGELRRWSIEQAVRISPDYPDPGDIVAAARTLESYVTGKDTAVPESPLADVGAAPKGDADA